LFDKLVYVIISKMSKHPTALLIFALAAIVLLPYFSITTARAAIDPETGYKIVNADTTASFKANCDNFPSGYCADVKIQRLDSTSGLDGPVTLSVPASYRVYARSSIGLFKTGADCFLYNPVDKSTVKVIGAGILSELFGEKWYVQTINNVPPGQYKHRFYCNIYYNGGTFEDSVDVCVSDPAKGGCGVPSPTSTPPPAQTLSAVLSSSPSSGITPFNPTLIATVSGTAQGTIHYQFDCTNNGNYEDDVVSNTNPYSTQKCNYPTFGVYTARVHIERGTATPIDRTTTIVVNNPQSTAPGAPYVDIKVQ